MTIIEQKMDLISVEETLNNAQVEPNFNLSNESPFIQMMLDPGDVKYDMK